MKQTYDELKKNMTVAEHKELNRIIDETSKRWRNFYIRVMHRQGWTNVKIAKEVKLSESSVRAILKKN